MENLPNTLPSFAWHFIKKHKLAFFVFFTAPLLSIAEAVVMPYAFKMVIDAFTYYDQNRAMIMEAITFPIYLIVGSWCVLIIGCRLQEWWQIFLFPKVEADMRMCVTKHVINHSYTYFSNNLSGNIANKIADIPRVMDALSTALRWQVISTFGVIAATLVMAFLISATIALIIAFWVMIDIMVSLCFVRYINTASTQNAEDKSELSGRIVDTITNILSTKLFAKKYHELQYIQTSQLKEQRSNIKIKGRMLVFHTAVDWPVTVMWGVLGYVLIDFWQAELITTGDMVFIFSAIWGIMFRLWFLGEALAGMFKDYGTGAQALTILLKPHDIIDKVDEKILRVPHGCIQLKNVVFQYNADKTIFNNKTITIEAGEKVGLVGFSGSGKTTFVHLLLRFFDIQSGTITIDGQNIAEVTQDSLRKNIAMIPQDPSLFHRSLMDNIRYGNLEASDEEVIQVAKKAHCHDFIEQLPEKYETQVGERGIKLSGGQRQRIAIARAMLKQAPILILDEATSALDSITERHIQAALRNLSKAQTTIVIAHRLSTLSDMNRILVFDDGKIIEDGTHEALLALNGHYTKMWNMQMDGFLPEKNN
jgi:ATP-binding cassette subfamily B protein